MGYSTGNANKKTKLRKQARMIKKIGPEISGEKGTGNTGKNNTTTSVNKPESAGKRRKIKEISIKGKTIQTKQDFPKKRKKKRKKILSTIGRE